MPVMSVLSLLGKVCIINPYLPYLVSSVPI